LHVVNSKNRVFEKLRLNLLETTLHTYSLEINVTLL